MRACVGWAGPSLESAFFDGPRPRLSFVDGSERHTADVVAHVPEQKEVPQPSAPTLPLAPLPMSPGVIEVEFTGARVRIRGPVDASIVAAVMQALTDVGNGDDLSCLLNGIVVGRIGLCQELAARIAHAV